MSKLVQSVDPKEVAALLRRFGPAPIIQQHLNVDSPFLDGPHQLLTSNRRRAEVCYVMHRGDPAAGVLLHRKLMYPPEAYRLPTGGIHEGEAVLDSLAREIEEETSFRIDEGPNPVWIEAFLGVLVYDLYHRSQDRVHKFATYHFLVAAPSDAQPITLDPAEKVAGWRWRPLQEMASVADELEHITKDDPTWVHWGRFRAMSHRFLASLPQRSGARNK